MEEITKLLLDNNSITVLTTAMTMAVLSYVILKYLNDSKRKEKLMAELINDNVKIVEKRNKGLENLIKKSVSEEEKQEQLINLYQQEINNKINEIRKTIKEEKQIKSDPEKHRYNQLVTNFENVRNRLLAEVESLSRRANLNLTIGIISSIIAIGFLFYSGWYTKIEYNEKWFNFVTFFIPKFSLLVFLGTFSFYFLNLYKSNLGVIQNYQNELNNVDFKIISMTSLLLSQHQDKELHLKELISGISNTEWNKVLKANETTVELEKLKQFNSFDKEMAFKLWTMNQFFKEDKPNNTETKK